MESFEGKLAVVTGGGSGMGRELVRQLAGEGCRVAACDLNAASVTETAQLANEAGQAKVTAHPADVSDESQVIRFRDELLAAHEADHVDLVFSNAGIGGGGSFVTGEREEWERVFAVDWQGVYYCARTFLPLLIKSPEGVLVNTSSVNGFFASLGEGRPHTAYSTAKFAVKGFTEALIEDLRVNAPHVRVALVMPGHIGTDIVANSGRALGRSGFAEANDDFKAGAVTTAADAAAIILDGVRSGQWRILVGEDAHKLDAKVRADPGRTYDYGENPKTVLRPAPPLPSEQATSTTQ
jgi:NAD(P)-dependent dehydrogenase (short-subunit alcohol dehydrogenase family)